MTVFVAVQLTRRSTIKMYAPVFVGFFFFLRGGGGGAVGLFRSDMLLIFNMVCP